MSEHRTVPIAVHPALPATLPPNTVVACGLMALLIFGVLAFGAVEYWSVFVLRVGSAILLLLWAAEQARRGRVRIAQTPVFIPMAVWAVLVMAQYLSGRSAYLYATFSEAMNFVVYGIVAFLAVQCFRGGRAAELLAIVFPVFGAVLACCAMLQDATSPGRLYWLRVPAHGGSVYGPYVNHNHYAGLMEMLAPFALVLSLSNAVSISRRMLYGFAALLMSASLFLSGSRGGMVAFFAELLFLLACISVKQRGSMRTTWRSVLVICGLLVVLLLTLGPGQVRGRIADLSHAYSDEVAGGRWTVYRDSLRMWAERPLLGWGLGAFPTVFPRFRSFHSDLVTNQAHNDVLQVGVEAGVAGFTVMITFVVLLYRTGLRNAGLHESVSAAVTSGALAGYTGLLVHSFTDFNLHIPANAALFFFLCGIAARGDGQTRSAVELAPECL